MSKRKRRSSQTNLQEDERVRRYFIQDVIKTLIVTGVIFGLQALLYFFWFK